MAELTIGMATYNDFDGVYFTLQALRLYHDLRDTELLVVDNYGCEHTKNLVEGGANGRYILSTDVSGTAATRDLVFREAKGETILCCDSHVLFVPGAIARLRDFYRRHPDCHDLLQGPLLHDDAQTVSTHLNPVWRDHLWGRWATDPTGLDPEGEPFDIPMQGLGAFSCRKGAWLGFNPRFRGCGGEEGYIHEKFRQAGRRTLCLPWFRWMRRIGRPSGVPYTVTVDDAFRNYVIGHAELGLDLEPIITHFSEYLTEERIGTMTAEALAGDSPDRAPLSTVAGAPGASAGQAGFVADLGPQADDSYVHATDGTPFDGQPWIASSPSRVHARAASAARTDYPPVSCVCPTYGRPELLEEAIYSFLQQDYPGAKELIILNDFEQQFLTFEHPEVTVVNVPRRFRSLGEKHNAVVALASHDLIFIWDDDDICLPHRLSFSVERFDPRKGYFNPRRAWFWNDGKLRGPESNAFHAASCWSRELFESVRGYAPRHADQDLEIEGRFEEARPGSTAPFDVKPEETYYIYRWGGTGSYHQSGFALGPRARQGATDFVAEQVRLGRLNVGEIGLAPRWKADYPALVRAYLASSPSLAGAPLVAAT